MPTASPEAPVLDTPTDGVAPAMPSIHVAYAMVTASGIRATGGPWARRLAPGYPPLVALVVIVTANHYVLDAVGGAALGRLALRAARLSA